MKTQSVGKALFGGTGGFFVMHSSGQGDLLINAYGDIMEINVDEDHPITIDNEHVVAWDDSLDYEIKIASGTFGFTTGEGLVNVFHGTGKVYIQSRNLHSLADALTPFIPQGKTKKREFFTLFTYIHPLYNQYMNAHIYYPLIF